MAASMDLNVQMDQIMALGRPSRKAKEDANNKIIITDSHNFQHHQVGNVDTTHLQTLGNPHFNNYYGANTSNNVMPMNVEGNYVDYGLQMNMSSTDYNQVNSDFRAKPFDIATINHNDQLKNKLPDENIRGTNMGPPITKKRRGRQPNQPNVSNGPDTDNSIYAAVRYGRAPIQTIVDDWIEHYNSDRVSAMLDLMQFFISSCGCKGKLTEEIFTAQVSQAQVIRKLTEEFDEDNGEYPLIQTTPQAKRFRSNFVEFIAVLIRQCQYSIIYDQQMIDQLTSLLTVLTDSQVRAFRHTGTLASMKLMTALVDVALNISINRDNNNRQLEAERSKQQPTQARLTLLANRKREFEDNLVEVKNMLTFLVKGVFVHRYRDSQADIRCICMQEIGVWMHRLPEIFLDDSYLKYVGWTLYDRVGSVRAQCLKTLQPLYEEAGLFGKLELFTSRFKSRLVDMTLDKEADVAVLAVKVVCCILRHNKSVLDDRDCENVYELVYCTNRALAQSAGEFLSQKLFQIDLNAPVRKSRKGKKRSENTPLMRDLVQFFIESELHEHAGYLVDSLWDVSSSSVHNNNNTCTHMIRDWECMTDLLLEEPGKGEAALSPAQESALVEILYWSVRQASTGESPVGRSSTSHHHTQSIPSFYGAGVYPGGIDVMGGNKAGLSGKLNKVIVDDRNRLTEILIPTLPNLISKFSEDTAKMLNIVQLPLYMSLDMYTSGRHERYLDLLIKHLQQLVDRHTNPDLLLHISEVFCALCADELSISTKCQIALGTLLDRIVESYRQSYNQYYSLTTRPPTDTSLVHHSADSAGEEESSLAVHEPSQQDAYRLHSAIRKLYAFYVCHDLRSLGLWESLIKICHSAQNQAVFHEEIVANAISTCYFGLLWQLNVDDPNSLSQSEIATIQKNLKEFFSVCHSYLEHKSDKIAEQSYKSICDLLIICTPCIKEELPDFAPFVYTPDSDMLNALILFLEQRVFIEDDGEEDENVKIEDLHNRRTNLAMFLKLMVYNVIPIRSVSSVYKSYIRYFNDFGDIMKTALAKAREINRVHTARMIMDCLISGLDDLIAENGTAVDRTSEGFQALKELARRLNLSFGLDLIKIREAMIELHRIAVDTVLSRWTVIINSQQHGENNTMTVAPANILCLELAAEFSNKLIHTDKRLLLDVVNRAFSMPSSAEDVLNNQNGWAPLHNYRVSLDPSLGLPNTGVGDATSTHSAGSNHHGQHDGVIIGPRPRGRPRKNKDLPVANVGALPSVVAVGGGSADGSGGGGNNSCTSATNSNSNSPSTKKKRLVLTVNTVNNTATATASHANSNDDNDQSSDAQSNNSNTPRVSNRGRVLKNRVNYSENERLSEG